MYVLPYFTAVKWHKPVGLPTRRPFRDATAPNVANPYSNIALQQQLPLILACQSRRLHHKMMAMPRLMLWAYPV